LEHEGQTLHDKVEVPGGHTIHLALPVSASIDDGSTHIHLSISGEPLFAQHGEKRGEEGSSQTRVQDGLDVNDGGIGAGPLGESGIGTSWDIAERGAGNDPEEIVAHLLKIRFEIALNVENESGCDCRE